LSRPAARRADIPGVSTVAAAELIAEIGVDMTRFPSAAHLVSWAKFCPQIHQSAGKSVSKGRAKL
jgi:transposase